MALVLQLLTFRGRSLFRECRAPFADDSFSLFLVATKTEAANKFWIVVIDRGQGQEGVLRVELFDFPQRLRNRICFWKVAQRFAQEILDGRFAVELINIAVMPFIAGSIEVRHVCQKNCFPRQKRAYGSARNPLRKIPVVPTSESGQSEREN